MRERPQSVLIRLNQEIQQGHQIVISAITYAEMRYGEIGKKASPKHAILIQQFLKCVDSILAWDIEAIDKTIEINKQLSACGMRIGANDMAIAGHAIASNCILVTNNVREFSRVDGLNYQDWC